MGTICEGWTWVVWIDHQGKWHSSDYGWIVDPLADEGARQFAKALVGNSSGTATFIGTAQAAYCIHVKGRYRAFSLAKKAYCSTLLSTEQAAVYTGMQHR